MNASSASIGGSSSAVFPALALAFGVKHRSRIIYAYVYAFIVSCAHVLMRR
jgi:hypothetical protein